MIKLSLALDWTPNTLHAPILIAAQQGFYRDLDIDLSLVSPSADSYATTPAKKLLNGTVDLAICPSESVIAYAVKEKSTESTTAIKLEAVMALLDTDGSSILCASLAGISRPRDLDGKLYGSYNARYEDDIVRAMIRNDGGQGQIKIAQECAKLDLFEILTLPATGKMEKSTAEEQQIEATWVFSAWEGIKARQMGFDGVEFRMSDYGVPYGYSPLVARATNGKVQDDTVDKFLKATKKGYEFVIEHFDAALSILQSWCPSESQAFLSTSLVEVQQFWRQDGRYGHMDEEKWQAFLGFLRKEKLLEKDLHPKDLYFQAR